MMNAGAINQLHFMSDRTQYGILSRGLRYKHVIDETVKIQREIVENIENGGFAKEWENKITKLKFRLIKFMSTRVGIGKLEKRVRKALKMPQIDIFAEIPYPDMEEIKKNQRLKQELSEFNLYSEF
jgi:ketol-acid reductoisomerase